MKWLMFMSLEKQKLKSNKEVIVMKQETVSKFLIMITVLCMLNVFVAVGEAGTAAGLPWEAALTTLSNSLTGPVAFALGLFMIVCGFCAIAFTGADMGGWVRWVAMAAILAGMLGAAPTVLDLFGLTASIVK